MLDTLVSMRADVTEWLGGENLRAARINSAINDAIESLWQSLILAALNIFMNGPVTISIAAGDEGLNIVSIEDPTSAPTATDVAGGSLAATSYQIAYTYVTESGSETLLSPVLVYGRGVNATAQVSIPITTIDGAIGWNLYVGTSTNNLAKQNDEPIPILTGVGNPAQQTYDEPSTGFVVQPDGPAPPTENTTGDNIFYIRHLEFQTSQGGYQAYNAADLDSEMMRRLSATTATASEYQRYAWDLINQRQLEIRPAAGTSFIPRYFFIQKPRRLLFDSSPLPFPTLPSTEFIKTHSLSALFLSLHEYEASAAWEKKSDKALQKAVRAISQINTNRNTSVTPYMYR